MSGIILDRICYVAHLTKDLDNNNKEQYQIDTGLTTVAINIQPGAAEDTIMSDGVFTQTWLGFVVQSGIRSGDLVTVSGVQLKKFVVKGIEDWDMLDIPHYALTLTEFEESEIV